MSHSAQTAHLSTGSPATSVRPISLATVAMTTSHLFLSSASELYGHKPEGGGKSSHLHTHTNTQEWHGGLPLMPMQRDWYTENLPPSSSSSASFSSLWFWSVVRGEADPTLPTQSHDAIKHNHNHDHTASCLWFIHIKASIIQNTDQVVVQKLSSRCWHKDIIHNRSKPKESMLHLWNRLKQKVRGIHNPIYITALEKSFQSKH